MTQSLASGETDPSSGEHESIVMGAMEALLTVPPVIRLTASMVRKGWQLFPAAVCRHCHGITMWNPRSPAELKCTFCNANGETPDQNAALFIERVDHH